ncbi:MAG: hypothetical protein ACFLMY_08955 [Candidatus Brachytrichaceae bacterium NZ_4S206]
MTRNMLAAGVGLSLTLALTLSSTRAQMQPLGAEAALALMGTAFTYQGRLNSSGAPVNGACDFQFGLWDAASGGTQIGSTQTKTNVSVGAGYFTIPDLDFGSGAFNGDARWLAIAVRCPAGSGSYTGLSPRQALTPAPYALALPGLWTQQNAASPNLIGGFHGNQVTGGVAGATIGGGGNFIYLNRVTDDYGTVGGGTANQAGNDAGTPGDRSLATVGGGFANIASGYAATVGGGQYNTASGLAATVAGGSNNAAAGDYSFVAGRRAKNTNPNHDGVFIFADSTDADFTSTASNQFLVRAAGGVGVNTNSPIANTLTVNGQVIAGGANPPGGDEPFIAQGNVSGISMDDRAGGSNPRWVIFPHSGTLVFWTSTLGSRVTINSSGKLTAVGGFNGQCLSSVGFSSSSGNACNMDVAESFASLEPTEPGDLVVLERNATDRPTVRKSARPYEDLLVGAVSTNPGLVFDNGKTYLAGDNSQLITTDKTVVGLVGRVPVKVSMENGPIAIGDPLTSASQPGVAMKATRAGKIVGYAMQAADTDGKVLVLLQPGYYLPPDYLALQQQNASLEARLAALERGAGVARSSAFDLNVLGIVLLGVLGGGAWLVRQRKGGRR